MACQDSRQIYQLRSHYFQADLEGSRELGSDLYAVQELSKYHAAVLNVFTPDQQMNI